MPVPQKLREEEWVIIPIAPGNWQVGVMGLTPEAVSEEDLIKILKNRGLSDSEIRKVLEECMRDGKIWAQKDIARIGVMIEDRVSKMFVDVERQLEDIEKNLKTLDERGRRALFDNLKSSQITLEGLVNLVKHTLGEFQKGGFGQVSLEGREQQSQFLSTFLMDKVEMALKMLAPLIALGDWRVMNAINILTTKIKAVRGEEVVGQKIKGRRLLIDLFVAPINEHVEIRVDSKENWFSSWLENLLKVRLEMDKVVLDKLIGRKDPLWKRVGDEEVR